jgi:hypothetical protein
MKPIFADTSYYLGLLNNDDQWHEGVMRFTQGFDGEMVTTAWVLTELANAMSHPDNRGVCVGFFEDLRSDPRVMIVGASQALFDQGFDLYAHRLDKSWSLTDCISFVVMQQQGLTEALTGDRHFEQAGFKALLAQEEK